VPPVELAFPLPQVLKHLQLRNATGWLTGACCTGVPTVHCRHLQYAPRTCPQLQVRIDPERSWHGRSAQLAAAVLIAGAAVAAVLGCCHQHGTGTIAEREDGLRTVPDSHSWMYIYAGAAVDCTPTDYRFGSAIQHMITLFEQ
jgi:hypothetical protein